MDSIKDIVPKVVKNISEQKPEAQDDVLNTWQHSVDKKTFEHTRVVGIKKGKLLVFTDSPVRLFDLTLQRAKILKQMQEKIPELQEIVFRIGKV